MLRLLAVLIAAACSTAGVAAPTCGGDLRGARKIESDHYVLVYRTQPAKIVVGKHFSVDLVSCPKGDAPLPEGVAVDATMPEHGHGMNYKAVVKPTGNDKVALKPAVIPDKAALNPAARSSAHYRADGLMFHMPGRWDLTFELRAAGKSERLTGSIVLE